MPGAEAALQVYENVLAIFSGLLIGGALVGVVIYLSLVCGEILAKNTPSKSQSQQRPRSIVPQEPRNVRLIEMPVVEEPLGEEESIFPPRSAASGS